MLDERFSNIKIEFKKGGIYARSDDTGSITGTWLMTTDEKELTTKAGDKPEKKYTIASISKTKLYLKLIATENGDVFLKAENQ